MNANSRWCLLMHFINNKQEEEHQAKAECLWW